MISYYKFKNPGNLEVIDELVERLDKINQSLEKDHTFCFYIPYNSNELIYYSCVEEQIDDERQVDPVFSEEFANKGIYPEKIDVKDFMKATIETGGDIKGSRNFYRECRQ